MPRAGWVKPESDERLSDHISIGVLTRTYPPELVDRVIEETGHREQRHRLLPARVTLYLVLALSLFSRESYEEVMRRLVEGLSWASGWQRRWQMPTKAAIFKARVRLGIAPLEALFDTAARPLAGPDTPGAFYRGWRLMSIDGMTLDVADTPANDEHFGRARSGRGERAAFPQARVVGLAETGTHAIIDAAVGPYTVGETTLTRGLLDSLASGMLLTADRGFYSFQLWNQATATGADLLWRVKKNLKLEVDEVLADGSWLTRIYDSADRVRAHPVVVRAVEYSLNDPALTGGGETYRLITTILDPKAVPAGELAALYTQRWEIETAIGEFKTHQRGPRLVLRSKAPDGVYQEIYGYLLVHYAIRTLMHEAALDAKLDPDRLSFIRSLRVVRRTTASHAGFSP